MVTETLNLILQLPEKSVFGVLIDLGLVANVLRPIGIPQGADGLVIVVTRWPNVGTLYREESDEIIRAH